MGDGRLPDLVRIQPPGASKAPGSRQASGPAILPAGGSATGTHLRRWNSKPSMRPPHLRRKRRAWEPASVIPVLHQPSLILRLSRPPAAPLVRKMPDPSPAGASLGAAPATILLYSRWHGAARRLPSPRAWCQSNSAARPARCSPRALVRKLGCWSGQVRMGRQKRNGAISAATPPSSLWAALRERSI